MGTTKDTEKSERAEGRGRGNLERDCFFVTRDLLSGKLSLPEGITVITPHAVGRLIKEKDGLDKAPSTGAVAANFVRWGDLGVVNLGTKPQHVKSFTAAFLKAGGDKGVSIDTLDGFKAAKRAKAKAARDAAKPAAPAKKAPAKKAAAKKAPAKKAAAKKSTGARKPKAESTDA